MKISLTVNGRAVAADVAPRTSLADFLREELLLTGTHLGCEHGICGACTVEIDGEIARSCITLAAVCEGASVRTIEGFDEDALMGRLRDAFREEHALQCGYCTPGMLIAARDLVRRKRGLSRADIRHEMSGNLCRCTGYMGIVSAIERTMAGQVEPVAAPARTWLGPAPGPVEVTASPQGSEPAPPPAASPPPAARVRAPAAPAGAQVRVTTGALEEQGGSTRLTQSFTLPYPRAVVWKLMSDPQAVAGCMPGAALDGAPDAEGRIRGRIAVRLGPIAASFAGDGEVRSFPAEFRQVIEGRGGDRKSGSRVSGSVDYRLSEATAATGGEGSGAGTRVDVVMSYALTGLLAQLGRSGLARDLAQRLGEAFAQNIDARLRDPGGVAPRQAEIGALSLVLQLAAARLRALVSRLLGR